MLKSCVYVQKGNGKVKIVVLGFQAYINKFSLICAFEVDLTVRFNYTNDGIFH